ncbi:MAG: hypothetical protein YFSK_0260 [Candidatus Yanofskyibacterium parasiticum]|nr:MAG: hypothetical protein YFSK_0260 [Candidatus Yanofskybacteria bacterium]
MDAFEIKGKFGGFVKCGKRLGVLFVAQNGKVGEGILGMVTAWGSFTKNVLRLVVRFVSDFVFPTEQYLRCSIRYNENIATKEK